jgi:hypothetical protein
VYVGILAAMRRTNVWLRLAQIRDLKSIARENGATIAGLIRLAIDQFIERRKAEKRDSGNGHEK